MGMTGDDIIHIFSGTPGAFCLAQLHDIQFATWLRSALRVIAYASLIKTPGNGYC